MDTLLPILLLSAAYGILKWNREIYKNNKQLKNLTQLLKD